MGLFHNTKQHGFLATLGTIKIIGPAEKRQERIDIMEEKFDVILDFYVDLKRKYHPDNARDSYTKKYYTDEVAKANWFGESVSLKYIPIFLKNEGQYMTFFNTVLQQIAEEKLKDAREGHVDVYFAVQALYYGIRYLKEMDENSETTQYQKTLDDYKRLMSKADQIFKGIKGQMGKMQRKMGVGSVAINDLREFLDELL